MGAPAPDLGSIWQRVLGELEVSVTSHSFKTFLQPTNLMAISSDESEATISVPNPFSSAQIKARFETTIIDSLRIHFPKLTKLIYKVVTAPKKKLHSQPEALFTSPNDQNIDTPQPQSNIFDKQNHLLGRYNFQNFVVGSSNRLAYSAGQLVAEKPGTNYNPLFLYGPAGVGKTHLMWAMYGEIKRLNPNLELLYITIEEFYKSFVDSVRKSEAFTNKYREVDVLFVDDIQFIKKKETTQEEFFHTFNSLHQSNKQIVICSDRPPKEIPELEERLRSRFEWGMVVDMQPPDLETRVAIIQSKAEAKRFAITMEVAEAIADKISANIRELEGGFNRVLMYCELHNLQATLEVVEEVLGQGQPTSTRRKMSPKQVISEVARYYGVSADDILGKKRSKDIVMPRQITMYLLRSELDLSFPQIGSHLGGRDHTTIMYGYEKIETMVSKKDEIIRDIQDVRQRITQERVFSS
ncbi:chromosomal replication initiator protein DnaA [bacterium]|nr:chromosomal replication initiator protein DnaA [bacterium]